MKNAAETRSGDLELARRCALGEGPAQEQLFAEQSARIHLILFRILGTNRDIEDLVQEAFVAVFRSLPSYRGEAALSTWVDRITARTAFAYLSRRSPPTVRLGIVGGLSASNPTPEQGLLTREAARRWYALLDRLAPKYRIAYVLHVIDERPIAEVAAITEVSLIAAKNRVWRARRMVQGRAEADSVLKEFLRRSSGGAR